MVYDIQATCRLAAVSSQDVGRGGEGRGAGEPDAYTSRDDRRSDVNFSALELYINETLQITCKTDQCSLWVP